MAAKNPRRVACIAFIVASGLLGADAPTDLAKRVAEQEARSGAERAQYTYRQTFLIEELTDRGAKAGEYHEVREIIFSPTGERTERLVQPPKSALKRLRLTDEDFRDMREVQPLLFTPDRLFLYETHAKGEEQVEGVLCWILQVRPKQILNGVRYFDGLFWVDQRDYSIIRSEGRAVPQVYSTRPGKENLFPFFTTHRQKVGEYWFPALTQADDTLHFSSGPIRERFTIRYRDYRRFGVDSKVIATP